MSLAWLMLFCLHRLSSTFRLLTLIHPLSIIVCLDQNLISTNTQPSNMDKEKHPRTATQKTEMNLPALQENHDLWYKIKVLLYDLCNIATDRASESRTLATTDELYISAPYFTADESTLIKSTQIIPPIPQEIPEFEQFDYERSDEEQDTISKDLPVKGLTLPARLVTIEDAIKECLVKFFEKRRASGDARPCGPHDMGPIYLAIFGVSKEELKDEKFLSRLRRAGLPRLDKEEIRKDDERNMQRGGRKGSQREGKKGTYKG